MKSILKGCLRHNLGAQSHVKVSFEIPEYTADVDGIWVLHFLDAIKETGISTKFYEASSIELYGKVQEMPQTEKTSLRTLREVIIVKINLRSY